MIGYIAALIAKKKVEKTFSPKSQVRVDESWPLGIKLGRTVVLEETPFFLADDLEVKFPGSDNAIRAVGIYETRLVPGVKTYRIYLQKVGGEEESVLQISVEQKTGAVLESILYRVAWEIFPSTKEEFDTWFNEENGILGYKDMKTPNGKEYSRVMPASSNDMVKPCHWREHYTNDPHIADIAHIDYDSVVYGRKAGELSTEYLLVSKVEEEGSVCIRIYAGIPMDAGFIKIL